MKQTKMEAETCHQVIRAGVELGDWRGWIAPPLEWWCKKMQKKKYWERLWNIFWQIKANLWTATVPHCNFSLWHCQNFWCNSFKLGLNSRMQHSGDMSHWSVTPPPPSARYALVYIWKCNFLSLRIASKHSAFLLTKVSASEVRALMRKFVLKGRLWRPSIWNCLGSQTMFIRGHSVQLEICSKGKNLQLT